MTRQIRSVRKGIIAILFALTGSLSFAIVCEAELMHALPASSDPSVASGVDAARLLERAVRLVDPALPRLVVANDIPLEVEHPDHETIRFLAERRLLPPLWTPASIDAAVWSDMLSRFSDWYQLDPITTDPPQTDADLVADLAGVLDGISRAIRPAAVLATDPASASGLAFRALIMNWTVYPRLIVFRPDADVEGPLDIAAAIASLETCARQIEHYFSASADTATQLFLANNRASMIVVGSTPADTGSLPSWIDVGDEVDAFSFQHPAVAALERYSVVFDGPAIGIAALIRLLPGIRTNVSPLRLRAYLQTPR